MSKTITLDLPDELYEIISDIAILPQNRTKLWMKLY